MQALGIENYGIINVVGGFVSMFSIISSSLTSACQRFLSFEIGKKSNSVKYVFSATFYIHIILAIIVFILTESFGLYFLNNKLNIPPEKLYDATWVFHCSVVSLLLSLLNIPYNALMVAYERMKPFAYISIIQGVLKLLVVLLILKFPNNILVTYALLTLLSSIVLRIIVLVYCRIVFREDSTLSLHRNNNTYKSIFSFAGWSFFGNASSILNSQGINMLLNIFGNVVVNAARGISSMIENVILNFVHNFTSALNPQIVKAYAKKDFARFEYLVDLGMRISFSLMWIMVIPMIVAIPEILKIWLTDFPDLTIDFTRITLINATIQAMAIPFMTAINSTGNIKWYQIVVGITALLNIPVSYLFLNLGFASNSVYYISLSLTILTFVLRLLFVKYNTDLKTIYYYKTIFIRFIPVSIFTWIICMCIYRLCELSGLLNLLIYLSISALLCGLLLLLFCSSKTEKKMLLSLLSNKMHAINTFHK